MKKLLSFILAVCLGFITSGQTPKTELYDLIKKLSYDSTGYENVGDWAVDNPKKYPVLWKLDRIEMSDDTSINFFRMGNVNIAINGKTFTQNGLPVKWTIMLKGPRMGYASYSIISSPSSAITPKLIIDSMLYSKNYRARLIKSCDKNAISGFNYYEVKIPKKDVVFIKLSWFSLNGNTALRIDGYDSWSKNAAKLDCPK